MKCVMIIDSELAIGIVAKKRCLRRHFFEGMKIQQIADMEEINHSRL